MKVIIDLDLDQIIQSITDNSKLITLKDVPPDPVASFRFGVTYAVSRIQWIIGNKYTN